MSAMLDGDKYSISYHAAQRANEMGMTFEAIICSITRPEDIRIPGEKSKYHNTGRHLHDWGDYTAVVQLGEKIHVLTFLWRYKDGWERSYLYSDEYGRERRENPFAPKDAA